MWNSKINPITNCTKPVFPDVRVKAARCRHCGLVHSKEGGPSRLRVVKSAGWWPAGLSARTFGVLQCACVIPHYHAHACMGMGLVLRFWYGVATIPTWSVSIWKWACELFFFLLALAYFCHCFYVRSRLKVAATAPSIRSTRFWQLLNREKAVRLTSWFAVETSRYTNMDCSSYYKDTPLLRNDL